ncbi:hypothetical protein DIPPA_04012 [Diplonema papillatum]|nr:hypothetical protein DIPPA_04012 [Diplonema papillatum]
MQSHSALPAAKAASETTHAAAAAPEAASRGDTGDPRPDAACARKKVDATWPASHSTTHRKYAHSGTSAAAPEVQLHSARPPTTSAAAMTGSENATKSPLLEKMKP